MKRNLKLCVEKVSLYELELPDEAEPWCKKHGWYPVRRQQVELIGDSLRNTIVLQFQTRRAAVAAVKKYDREHGIGGQS